MAKYTITIGTLMKNNFNFGLDTYPIFDNNYRQTLNQKILNHYYNNEIGFETPELFKFYLNNKLNEIMPYYNTLYENLKLYDNNLMSNVNLKEVLNRETANNVSSQSNSSTDTRNLYQDTPQGSLKETDIDNLKYATNLTLNDSKINDNATSQGDGTENYIKTIVGNNGSKYTYELLNELKNGILNIDMMIIDDLNELFMGVF
jgi:hypothetical protein